MFRQLASRTSVLTVTVRGPMEEFQKKLRSNPYSASDLEFAAEKGPLRHKTADAPTHNGQNGYFCPTWYVSSNMWGHRPFYCKGAVSLQETPNQTQSKGLILAFFEIPSWGRVLWPSTRRFDVPPSKYRDSSAKKVSYFFGAPQKFCSKIKKFQKIF